MKRKAEFQLCLLTDSDNARSSPVNSIENCLDGCNKMLKLLNSVYDFHNFPFVVQLYNLAV